MERRKAVGETRGERGYGERQWVKRARSKNSQSESGGKAWGKSERKLRPPQGGLQRTPCLRSPQPTLTEPAGERGSDLKYRIKMHPRGVHFSLYNFVRFRGEYSYYNAILRRLRGGCVPNLTPSEQSGFYENQAARPFSFCRAQAKVRCAQPQDNPQAAAGRRECQIHICPAAALLRKSRT